MFCLYYLVCLTPRSTISTDEDMYHHRHKQRSFSRYPINHHHHNSSSRYHPVLKIKGNTAHIHISYRIHAHQVSLVNIHPLMYIYTGYANLLFNSMKQIHPNQQKQYTLHIPEHLIRRLTWTIITHIPILIGKVFKCCQCLVCVGAQTDSHKNVSEENISYNKLHV